MKAMILAAGFGIRMQPLTLTTPKPLVQVRGRALIDYHLDALRKSKIKTVVINVHHLGSQIIAHVKQHWDSEFELHFFQEEKILGTGGGVYQALSLFDDEPFMVLSADIFTDYPLHQLPRRIPGLAHLVMVNNPSFHPEGDFALNDGRIALEGALRLTYGNIGVFHPELFAGVSDPIFELRDVFSPAIAKNKVTGEHYLGRWENIGTMEQLARFE